MPQTNVHLDGETYDILRFIAGLEPEKYKTYHDVVREACREKAEKHRKLYLRILEEKNEVQS